MNSKRLVLCVAALLVLAIFAPGLAAAAEKLTFIPVAPCRVADTRCSPPAMGVNNLGNCPNAVVFSGNPNVGGNDFAASETKAFNIVGNGDMLPQGGPPAGCGIPGYDIDGPIVRAVAINLTAITPNNKGNFRVWDSALVPPAVSNVNFTTNVNIANSAIVALAQDGTQGADLSALTGGPVTAVHLVVDVVGYFIEDAALTPFP